jgi:MarR-like DNA-binding transcriptional regulator SgrR of sgrS sRNA
MMAAPLSLDLRLAFAWPDLERSLCHPVLSIVPLAPQGLSPGLGPFTLIGGILEANPSFPWGRPYLNKVAVTAADERKALRLFSLKQAHVLIGGEEAAAGTRSGPALYATYLVFVPDKVGSEFRVVFDSAVDRADLTRFFVRSASSPMYKLLPPALMPQEPPPRTGPPKPVPRRELTLLYDQAQPEQRAVAERIQVKLHSRGYRISLKGVPRSELRSRWSSGQFDLMLQGVLLPPVPSLALPVVIELAGRHSLLDAELRSVGAEADEEARFRKARERAEALAPELPLIPLYAQSARIAVLPQVTNLDFDAQGLPDFDGAFIGAE